MNAFIKQLGKLNGDLSIQKSLLTFAKDVINAVKKGRKKNAATQRCSTQPDLKTISRIQMVRKT